MKAYRTIPIRECGEPLMPIPKGDFAFFDPPPYMAFGASYGDASVLRFFPVNATLQLGDTTAAAPQDSSRSLIEKSDIAFSRSI